jgi:hypothetical protein
MAGDVAETTSRKLLWSKHFSTTVAPIIKILLSDLARYYYCRNGSTYVLIISVHSIGVNGRVAQRLPADVLVDTRASRLQIASTTAKHAVKQAETGLIASLTIEIAMIYGRTLFLISCQQKASRTRLSTFWAFHTNVSFFNKLQILRTFNCQYVN